MQIVKPSASLWWHTPDPIRCIEMAGRVCYKSEDKITSVSADKFVRGLVQNGHLSVLEHAVATFHLVCDRGVSHELVRHRIASYSQESTRYCNYGTKGGEIAVIDPGFCVKPGVVTDSWAIWRTAMQAAEDSYLSLLSAGCTPQYARSVLPNSLKTEVVATANFREWRLILAQRTSTKAHPAMQELMGFVKTILVREFSPAFDDL